MDIYSNILYVKEEYAALSALAHRCAAADKYRPETCCVAGNYYSLRWALTAGGCVCGWWSGARECFVIEWRVWGVYCSKACCVAGNYLRWEGPPGGVGVHVPAPVPVPVGEWNKGARVCFCWEWVLDGDTKCRAAAGLGLERRSRQEAERSSW